ncbi:MAG: hypothetical protein LRY50_01805, partial [Geovibrio sp.]|nr:hypothetical protein [Geovibrio sp.]
PPARRGLTPYEIMLSESQERMLMVVRKGCEDKVKAIFDKWDLDAEVIGHVATDGYVRLRWQGEEVAGSSRCSALQRGSQIQQTIRQRRIHGRAQQSG